MKLHLPFFIAFFIFQSVQAQTLNDRAMEQAKKSFPQFYELLSLENDAHFPKAIEQNMLWCEKAFSTRQFTTRRLQTKGIPLLLAEVPDKEEEIKKFLGIAAPEKVGANFQEAMQYPTLNVCGLQALYVGEKARTLIPDKAVAEIDIRLVPLSDANKLIELV